MTYVREIPRDLFNEGDLLKCLGRLWLALDERRDHKASLDFDGSTCVAYGFDVQQDPSDGSIYSPEVRLTVAGEERGLFRPLNAREKWPLWARFGDDDVRVFDLDGALSPEFWLAITEGR